jgi:Ca2+-binding RTX toxin-like protein
VRPIVLLTLALTLILPATASASIAWVTTLDESPMVSQVRYTAATGERNVVSVTESGGVWEIRDPGATIRVGAACVRLDAHAARCTNANPGRYALAVATYDGDDRVMAAGDITRMVISGGAGDDVLTGGPNVAMSGGAGDDTIEFTRAPPSLSCGGGDDLLEIFGGRRHHVLDGLDVAACEQLRVGQLVLAVRPRRSGRALVLPARCVGTRSCDGRVALSLRRNGRSTPVGADSYRLAGGASTTLRVALQRSERRLLAARGTVVGVAMLTRLFERRTVRWRVRAAL